LIVHNCGYGLGSKKFREQLDTVYDVQVDEPFAERCIRAFRRKYSAISALWKKLETGFAYAVSNRSKRIRVGPVFMGLTEISGREFAFIEMPNGRRMFYAYPRVNEEGRVEYLGRNLYKGGAWEIVSTYGGKTTENLVQALSRDLLAGAMLNLDRAGFPLVLTVHDEVVAEGGAERLKEFEEIMKRVPPWATGLPLGVESFHCVRYRK
jgi:DNA polymerase